MTAIPPFRRKPADQVLALRLASNDSGADTIAGYLRALLTTLWQEEEGFSGKRPFGNSSWQYDLYKPMIAAGMVPGTVDSDGYIDQFSRADRARADELILAAIDALGT